MDDYKRGLYLQVRNELGRWSGTPLYVCYELVDALVREGADVDELDEHIWLFSIFPEFLTLFDGSVWRKNNTSDETELGDAWWENFWIEPRIRALDCILRD